MINLVAHAKTIFKIGNECLNISFNLVDAGRRCIINYRVENLIRQGFAFSITKVIVEKSRISNPVIMEIRGILFFFSGVEAARKDTNFKISDTKGEVDMVFVS
jgi:hypothetical protein